MVVSTSVMFLDMLSEAIRRKGQTEPILEFEICEYNGSVKSLEERSNRIRHFNSASSGPKVLLMSATSGGTRLNVTGASHIIICEPFWTLGDKVQIVGRCHHLGQKKTLHIWDIFAGTSEIDVMLGGSAQRKARFAELMNQRFISKEPNTLLAGVMA
ncbi:hypothetical protein QQZ08_002626 [Neonectria magnoliae]|uniref:Helicase C-terminal domain-containing protein n=1 Tax=Neonectria magnoliae TaxID=2732573 RepID=A0ABR1ID11_9HYPO